MWQLSRAIPAKGWACYGELPKNPQHPTRKRTPGINHLSVFRQMAAVEHGLRTLLTDTRLQPRTALLTGSSLAWDPVFFPGRSQAGDPVTSHH